MASFGTASSQPDSPSLGRSRSNRCCAAARTFFCASVLKIHSSARRRRSVAASRVHCLVTERAMRRGAGGGGGGRAAASAAGRPRASAVACATACLIASLISAARARIGPPLASVRRYIRRRRRHVRRRWHIRRRRRARRRCPDASVARRHARGADVAPRVRPAEASLNQHVKDHRAGREARRALPAGEGVRPARSRAERRRLRAKELQAVGRPVAPGSTLLRGHGRQSALSSRQDRSRQFCRRVFRL